MARTMRLTGTGTQLTLAPPEGPSALSLRRGESNWTIGSDDPALFLRIANNDRTGMRISPGGVVWVDRLNVNNNAICRRLPPSEGESYSFAVPDDAFSETGSYSYLPLPTLRTGFSAGVYSTLYK